MLGVEQRLFPVINACDRQAIKKPARNWSNPKRVNVLCWREYSI